MQFYDRSTQPAPACLSDSKSEQARRELSRIFSMSAEKSSQSRFSMQKYIMHDETLDRALSRLFHGRCAFCESARPTTAYRFRPVEEADPSKEVSRQYANQIGKT